MSRSRPSGHRDLPNEGRRRVVIEHMAPAVDGGRFPIKRVIGERVTVELDAFVDGHDRITGVLRYRHESEPDWKEVPLSPEGNDHWRAEFRVTRLGRYHYTAAAWVNAFATWQHDLHRRPPEDSDLGLV
jgi:starch synthase (maltosyl-transferring)